MTLNVVAPVAAFARVGIANASAGRRHLRSANSGCAVAASARRNGTQRIETGCSNALANAAPKSVLRNAFRLIHAVATMDNGAGIVWRRRKLRLLGLLGAKAMTDASNPTPNERIRAGLAERAERQRASGAYFAPLTDADLEELNARPSSTVLSDAKSVVELHSRAEALATSLETFLGGEQKVIDRIAVDAQERAQTLMPDIAPAQRYALMKDAVEAEQRQRRQVSQDHRTKTIRDAVEMQDVAKATMDALYTSPEAFLNTSTISNPERYRANRICAMQGPVGLRAIAARAHATGDADLGAAVLDALGAMTDSDRKLAGIDKKALAKALVGPRFHAMRQSLQAVIDHAEDVQNLASLFARGARSEEYGRLKLARGLRAQRRARGDSQ